ncbi:MAG: hypothetical protein NTY19_27680 [Planctomycetota bacterium]|nr:hypothetical protein [Planctomycetota bacterium]
MNTKRSGPVPSFSIHCPTCGNPIPAQPAQAGHVVACPQCNELVKVPEPKMGVIKQPPTAKQGGTVGADSFARSLGRFARHHPRKAALGIVLGTIALMLVCSRMSPRNNGITRQPDVIPSSNEPERPAQKPVNTYPVYTATSEVFCATAPAFLDSSPLIAPARFLLIEPGTNLFIAGFGGLTGKAYWELQAGCQIEAGGSFSGGKTVYVYQDQMGRFKKSEITR